jgi:membrane protease subunit (stomatin/prohibitin family)
MGVIGDMNRYQQYQMGNAMTKAAENPGGGGAAEGMGLGMGLAMANRMMPGMMGAAPAAGGAAAGSAPPPPPAVWHVAVGGQTKGPFSLEQLAAGISSGEVNRETMVWTAGMDAWSAASSVPALSNLFASQTPPPPPPPPAP